jgi:transaldolase
MKLYLDSADYKEIEEMDCFIDGITTNPTLLSKSKTSPYKIATLMGDRPVSVEAMGDSVSGIVAEARELADGYPNIVVKIPCNEIGLRAIRELSKEHIKTNATLIFSANQALLATNMGATYISPFMGRLDDVGESGSHLVKDITQIFRNYRLTTEIIAASIRSPRDVIKVAIMGCHIATVPYKVLKLMFNHPLTDKGIEIFNE